MKYYTIIDLCWGRHGVFLNSKRHIDRRGAEVNMVKFTVLLFNNTPCLPKHKSTIVLLYNKFILCIFPAILDH